MAKIKIEDLPKDAKISKEEMKIVTGGYSTYSKYVIAAPDYLNYRDAGQIQATARSQKRLLDSVLTGVGADIANGEVPL